ncbi:hypothetical protein N7517_008222 [Penicillium concentricum]|uniref:Uncharacterized protein n=1 Tax=Penicillium concentricum TaxID=293559 RepID=A0A9W9V3Y0_9EURO|nr:uncharacterized protein N7517_008222 [Penicillium concentricum]KAJ5365336.1 hypothetical protein N7517_008222 [Penicillium concentricum]
MYFVEGVVSEQRNKIETCLPWVFNGWSLPRSIELDKGLDDTWSVYGIEVTWKTIESKAKKGHKLKVGRLSNATPSAHRNNEFDLHVGLWVNREVLETFAPSLLDKSKREAGIKPFIPLRRSVRVQERMKMLDPLYGGI